MVTFYIHLSSHLTLLSRQDSAKKQHGWKCWFPHNLQGEKIILYIVRGKKPGNLRITFLHQMSFALIIRFSNGLTDFRIPDTPIEQISPLLLRHCIRNEFPNTRRRRLKFIYAGRVLNNKTDFGKEILEPAKLHQNEATTLIYIHCLVGDELTLQQLQEEESLDLNTPQQSTAPAPVGFDRLLSQGFSQRDINELRAQFQQLYANRLNGADMRQLEDRWIDSSVNNEFDDFNNALAEMTRDETSVVTGDNNMNLLVGILLGCFLGVLALFLLKLELGTSFNRKAKMAVIAGVFVNFSFGLIRMWS